jgi:hypothetical protein
VEIIQSSLLLWNVDCLCLVCTNCIDGEDDAPDSVRQSALWMWQNTTRLWHWISGSTVQSSSLTGNTNPAVFPANPNIFGNYHPGHRVSPTLVIDDANSLYLYAGELAPNLHNLIASEIVQQLITRCLSGMNLDHETYTDMWTVGNSMRCPGGQYKVNVYDSDPTNCLTCPSGVYCPTGTAINAWISCPIGSTSLASR